MSEHAALAQEITEYLITGRKCPPDAVRMMKAAAKLLAAGPPPARTKAPQPRYRDEGGTYHYGVPDA